MSVLSQHILDPEALAAAIRDANFVPCQLSVRPSPSLIARVLCPQVCLDFATLGPAMLFSGSMSRDCYTLVFVTACPQIGRSFNFATEHKDGYMGFFPPGGMLDAYTPEGYANATLTVPVPVFLAAVERSFPEIPETILKSGAGMKIGEIEQEQLRELLAEVMVAIRDPAEILAGEPARMILERDLLDAFLTALRGGCAVKPLRQRVAGRLKRLRKARDFLAERLTDPTHMVDLCRELDLSRRGLEVLFRDSIGIGPMTLLRHQRLHGARRALLTAPATPGAVKQSAIEWGFLHMGHFAREYRKFFGESPSATLAGRAFRSAKKS